ncbi:LytR/AlgR family response regulator transcription factor [Aliikangiella coralliicola]|uniref:Response regulator transcription factor n=1 Tax=Aliikangiella coralliicola TaxID=2592383 RepID=A0A545UC75_9GAMM|nr:LytTR family DNA-binding domain-containing protein [Aliikangiella coralliicola]TQV87064.1 response regulator transcription factor [Aliikangiella coralliicola]
MKAVIVEDSRLARKELLQLLKLHPEIEIVGEASSVESGIDKIESLKPALIFLDINLPDGNGFDLLEKLETCPKVIFTTAYDEYAIQAFEFNALDYLLKPINPKRLQQALSKCFIESEITEDETTEIDHKIFVKDGERCWLIDIEKIRYFESCGNYARIYFEQNKPMIYKSLSKIEKRLKEKVFIRTNRQYIVNVNFIENIEPSGANGLFLTMTDGKEIEVSRRHTSNFKQLLSF